MLNSPKDEWDHNQDMVVKKILRDNQPFHISSIIDPTTNNLTSNQEDVKKVITDGFSKIFSVPPLPTMDNEQIKEYQALIEKTYTHHHKTKKIDPNWYI